MFIIKEILFGGHVLSVGGAVVAMMYMLVLNLNVNLVIVLSVYLFGQSIYFLDRYIGLSTDDVDNKGRVDHMKKYVRFIPSLIISYLAVFVVVMVRSNLYIGLLFGICIFFVGLLYTYIFKPITQYVVMFKDIFVATFWSFFGVYVIVQYEQVKYSYLFGLFFIYIFIRSILMQVFFDLKDLKSDKLNNLKTFPLVYGQDRTYKFLFILEIISIMILLIGAYLSSSGLLFLSLVPIDIFFGGIIFLSKAKFKYSYILIFQFEYILSFLFMQLALWIS